MPWGVEEYTFAIAVAVLLVDLGVRYLGWRAQRSRALLDWQQTSEALHKHQGEDRDLLLARYWVQLRKAQFRDRFLLKLVVAVGWIGLAGLLMESGKERGLHWQALVLAIPLFLFGASSWMGAQRYALSNEYQALAVMEKKARDAYNRFAAANPLERKPLKLEVRANEWFKAFRERTEKNGALRWTMRIGWVLVMLLLVAGFVASYWFDWDPRR